MNRGGYFTKVSHGLTLLSGYSEAELLSMNLLSVMYNEDAAEILQAVENQFENSQKNYRSQRRFQHKNGDVIWISLSVSLALDGESGKSYFIAQLIDINEQKEAEKNKREFFANMSHELRTPLTSVKGSIDLVLGTMRGQLPGGAVKLLDIAKANSARLNELINDFLDLAKISSGNMPFSFGFSDIREIAREAAKLIEPMAQSNGVKIDLSVDSKTAMAWVDSSKLNQVLTNLLSNAVKFSEQGATVTLIVDRALDAIRVSVGNCGEGISESYQPHIFEPFGQGNSSETRVKGGTGLGLSIAKSLIEGMGGGIDFVSQKGEATVFTLTIPNNFPPNGLEWAIQKNKFDHIQVLHLDADKSFAEMFASGFDFPVKIFHASNLLEEVKLASGRRFDMLIGDFNREQDIDKAFEELREFLDADVPVIRLSNNKLRLKHPELSEDLLKIEMRFAEMTTECGRVYKQSQMALE